MIYFNKMIKAKNIDEAWTQWINMIANNENENLEEMYSRDGNVVGEIINAITVIEDPTRCIMKNDIRKMPIRYAIGEMLWYLSANNNLSEIQKYTSAWDRRSDDNKTVNSNYGWCIKYKYNIDQ